MINQLKELYRFVDPATRRRLKVAVIGLLIVSLFEMVGLVLLLPLMQMFAGASTHSGALGRVSSFFGDPSKSTLSLILAGIVFTAFLIKGIFTLVFRWWIMGFLNVQAAHTADDLLLRYLNAPYAVHLKRNTSDFIRVIQDAVTRTYMNTVIGILAIIAEGTTIAAVALVLFTLRPLPTLGTVAYFVVVGFVFLGVVKRRSQAASLELVESAEKVYRSALQGLGGIKEVQIRQRTGYFLDEFSGARLVYARAMQMALYLGEAPRYVMEMVFMVGIAVMSALVFTSSDSKQAAATLGLFVAAGFRILPSMVRLFASLNTARIGQDSVRLVLEDLYSLDAPTTLEPGEPVALSEGIRVEQVSFSYSDDDRLVLDDVNLTIPAGQSLAIVGTSGAGKTTLVDIILGLHKPTTGRVLVDDVDISNLSGRWQRAIGLVPQDVFLLDGSLRSNIAFGEPPEAIDNERMDEAIERAQLRDLIRTMADGVDTFVGERGVRLSGGQRQRIGIARALYLRPRLLVLDEATSSLDSHTEQQITNTIDSLQGSQTMLVVAHRLSTVRRCDQLIFMREGKIQTRGTFDEVREQNAEFAHLVKLGSLDSIDNAELLGD